MSEPRGTPVVARSLRRFTLALALVANAAPAIDSPVSNMLVHTPREFGYFIGDSVRIRAEFDLASDHVVQLGALPRPGRVNRWLSLTAVDFQRARFSLGARHHRVVLTYQVVNAPGNVLGVGTPSQTIDVQTPDGERFPVLVPSWGFYISPLTRPEERVAGSLPSLRPALPPPSIGTVSGSVRIGLLALAVLVALLVLAYVHLMLPLVARTRGPFARARRRIVRALRDGAGEDVAYEAFHRAVSETAGRAVFEHDLDAFFRDQPRFATLRTEIEQVFGASTAAFFTRPGESTAWDPRALAELCRQLSLVERGL